MKKFLVVLLSLGLILAFGMTASAADVKFSGSYIAEGAYESNIYQAGSGEQSAAAVWTRTRIQPVFQVADGLTLTTRFDALEKLWGNTQWKGGTNDWTSSRKMPGTSQTNAAKIQESIEFERSYVTFKTAAGVFDVGYQSTATWGTAWNNYEQTGARLKFTTQFGPVVMLAIWDKLYDGYMGNLNKVSNKVDTDNDKYHLAGIYKGKGVEAGLLYTYIVANADRVAADPFRTRAHAFSPYVKATFGPVYIEGEFGYLFGKAKEYEAPSTKADVDYQAYGGFLKGQMKFGPAYAGLAVGYSSGDDGSDATKAKNGFNAKGWNPALIMLGDDYFPDIFPGGNAYDSSTFSSWKNNPAGFMIYNAFGGFNVTPKLNLEAGLTYATFDKTPKDFSSNKIGTEFDVTATYKIYDNLSYMVGAGYLLTGDAFKGTKANAEVGNDYVLLNKLALSF